MQLDSKIPFQRGVFKFQLGLALQGQVNKNLVHPDIQIQQTINHFLTRTGTMFLQLQKDFGKEEII
jgi:hypothetical protein